ncbi:MAG: multicopper oxidase [Methanocella sp.]
MSFDIMEGALSSGQKGLTTEAISNAAEVKRYDRRMFLKMMGVTAGTVAAVTMLGKITGSAEAACGTGMVTGSPLPGSSIPKYVTQLVIPPAFVPESNGVHRIDMQPWTQQILPAKDAYGRSTGFGPTTVFAYGGNVKDPSTGKRVFLRNSPGATFEAVKGIPTRVEWINNLRGVHFLPVDPTLHWANPNKIPKPTPPFKSFPSGYLNAQQPIPTVTHLHGGEVPSIYDGHPDAWFTADGKHGPAFVTRSYVYPNEQQATTLFYHDHVLGMTRLNLYAGLAGFYLIRDPRDRLASLLPQGKYEVPLAIQDRMFFQKDDCGHNDLAFPYVGNVPGVHPYWAPEFFGDVVMVNGVTWPNLNVDRGQYRFRVLNGSNARFYNLYFSNGMSFVQIGSDGGYLQAAVRQTSYLLAPGERIDILVDFSSFKAGTKIILRNNANAPYPGGTAPDPNTVGQIMQFTVGKDKGFTPRSLPYQLNPTLYGYEWPAPHPGAVKRILTLNELLDAGGNSLGLFLNGQMWDGMVTETPKAGSTEEWFFVNLTGDAHPMHLHLTQFNLVSRQNFNMTKYLADWTKLNQAGLTNGQLPFKMTWMTKTLPIEPYLQGSPQYTTANEKGWKDIIKAFPNQITRIRVRFKKQDDTPYGFDPTQGPGYVWHCHIVDHEDNEMMRPMVLKK